MNSLKDKLYQYRLLVIIVCICLIGGCGYGLYKSFNKKDDSYVTHVKDGDSAVVKTGDVTITKDDLYEYFLDNDGLNMTLNSAINYVWYFFATWATSRILRSISSFLASRSPFFIFFRHSLSCSIVNGDKNVFKTHLKSFLDTSYV